MPQTNDALKILDRMIGNDADMRQMSTEETLKAQIAQRIYEARTAAGRHELRPAAVGVGQARRSPCAAGRVGMR